MLLVPRLFDLLIGISLAPAGAVRLDAALQHVLTPQFIVPQLLNLLGSAVFAFTLTVSDLSLAAPLANGGCAARLRAQAARLPRPFPLTCAV